MRSMGWAKVIRLERREVIRTEVQEESKRGPEFPKERKEITTIKNKDMDSWNVSSQSRLRSYME